MNAGLFSTSIIQSVLDFDVYKLNMMSGVATLYPDTRVRYQLIVRSHEDISKLLPQVTDEIMALQHLQFSKEHIEYIAKSAPFLDEQFLAALTSFRFNPQRDVKVFTRQQKDGSKQLAVAIEGLWQSVILYETLIMSIISEVRSRQLWSDIPTNHFKQVLTEKITRLKSELQQRNISQFKLADMGTRRRFSFQVQQDVLSYLQQEMPESFVGTSNYHLAKQLDLTPIGTVAHEWFMGHQALVPLQHSQKIALEKWYELFNGALSIALTDTIGITAFLNDFDHQLSHDYAGVRHDSGCPFSWGDQIIQHYLKQGINPKDKVLVFSDGLTFEKALDIAEYFDGKIQVSFGIGTFLTNDMGDYCNADGMSYQPLSMVIKLTHCDGMAVAKISDEPEKSMCEDGLFLMHLKNTFNLPLGLNECHNLVEQSLFKI